MSEEVKENTVEEKGTSMYVHQVDYETLCKVLSTVTDVNKMFTYNMPNKASKYAEDSFELINTLNEYIGGEDDWRINREKNVKLRVENSIIKVSDWEVHGVTSCLCVPKINSIILIPDDNSTRNGMKEPTKIIHLSNCIAVTPLLVRLSDEPIDGEDNKYRLGMTYEVITPTQEKVAE